MTDLAPLGPCPYRKGGHRARSFVTIDELGNQSFVWECRVCGAARLCGPDMTADEIEARLFGRRA